MSEALSDRRASSGSSIAVDPVGHAGFVPGQIAARLDRLPPTLVQWRYCLIAQYVWALAAAGGAYASFLYPYVWSSDFGHREYAWLNALQVGLGVTIGSYIGGYVADRFGRKTVLVIGSLLAGLGVVGGGLVAPSFAGLLAMAAGQSIGVGFVVATSMLYMHELVPPSFRGRMTLGAQASSAIWSIIGFMIGYVLVPDDYRVYLYVIGAASIIGAAALLTVPESPRWLETKGRMSEAVATLEKIERAVERRVGALPEPARCDVAQVEVTERVPLREVFRGETLRRTVLLTTAWFLGFSGIVFGFTAYQSIFLAHYGFTAPQFFLILMLLYGPGYAGGALVFSLFNERFERRSLVLIGAMVFAFAFALIWFFSYVHQVNAIQYVGWTLAGAGSALWLFNMHNLTATAFPTQVRSTATGLAFGIGHLGAVFGPVVVVYLGDATRDHGFYGFLLYCVIIGGLVPGLLVRIFGTKQSGETLERIAS